MIDLGIKGIIADEAVLPEAQQARTFLLADSDSVCLLEKGRLDVFLVDLEEGRPVGRRRHLFRIEEGHACFGMGARAEAEGVGFLAVGTGETVPRMLSRERLALLAQDPAHTPAVSTLIEAWVTTLSEAVASDLTPKKHTELEAGPEQLFPAGTDLRPPGVAWVRHEEGFSWFLGNEDLRLNGLGFVPVTHNAWLQTGALSKLTVADTASLVGEAAAWNGLDLFHDLFLETTLSLQRQAYEAEQQRLHVKAVHHQRTMSDALVQLGSVLEDPDTLTPLREGSDNPLFEACQLVGTRLGIEMKQDPMHKKGKPQRDPLGAITRASQVRTRRVLLRDDWWTQDAGPLLAQLEEDKRPVALLPASDRSYTLHDPTDRTETPVDEEVAATLSPIAFTFYRPFPDIALTLKDVLRFGFRGCRKDLLMIVLMGAAGGLISMLTPVATGMIFNDIVPGAERGQLFQITMALLLFAVVSGLFRVTQTVALLRVQGKTEASVQSAVWDRLLNLPLAFFRDYAAGDLAMRAMGINTIQQILSGATITSLLGGIFSIFHFGLLFYYSVELALWASLIVLVAVVVTVVVSRAQLRYQRVITNIQARSSGLVLQFLTGISKLRVAGAEVQAFSLWAERFSEQRRLQLKMRRLGNGFAAFNAALPVVSLLVVFGFAFPLLTKEATMLTGDFLAFITALNTYVAAVLATNVAFGAVMAAFPLYENAQPILKALPEVDTAKADPGELHGGIEIQHVSFRYDETGPLILRDVSLDIHPGEFVALVGPSGSGKSTILRLLMGFETPEAGTIHFDGQDLSGIDIQAVRRQMGVVLQDGRLLPGDIFTNIVGSTMATMDDAWEAARMAGLDKDVRQMPMGLHTVIGEGGGNLSGGQRQRLLIARAVVNRPRLLLFDEATSALDNETQAIVSASLDRLQATRVVVAHRLSTIINADRIYVLENGRVVQTGTYDELINQDGTFAELAKRQIA